MAIMSGFSFFPLTRFTTDYARFRSVFFVHGLSLNVLLRYYIQPNGSTVMGRIRIFLNTRFNLSEVNGMSAGEGSD